MLRPGGVIAGWPRRCRMSLAISTWALLNLLAGYTAVPAIAWTHHATNLGTLEEMKSGLPRPLPKTTDDSMAGREEHLPPKPKLKHGSAKTMPAGVNAKRLRDVAAGKHNTPTHKLQKQLMVEQTRAAETGPQGRPKLVYNHLPKTGGTYIRAHLAELVPKELLAIMTEFTGLTGKERKSGNFLIGSIRMPCEYYLSLWSYGSGKDGGGQVRMSFRKKTKADPQDYYGQTKPYNSTEDLARFTAWLEKEAGLLSSRLKESYTGHRRLSADKLSVVACWVRTEDLEDSLRACLEMYESRGGVVEWSKFPKRSAEHINQRLHAGCKAMYDDYRESLVVTNDQDVFKMFGFESCCA